MAEPRKTHTIPPSH